MRGLSYIIMLAFLGVTSLGIWEHSFHHLTPSDESKCKILVHANVVGSEYSEAYIPPIISFVEIDLVVSFKSLFNSEKHRLKPKSRAPPFFIS